MIDWRPISEYDVEGWNSPDVLIWSPEFDHPSSGKYYEGQWMLTANGYDTMFIKGSFDTEYSVECPEPTHFAYMNTPNAN